MSLTNGPGILAILVVFGAVPLNWFVAWALWRLSRQDRDGRVLRVMAIFALAMAVIVTVFGLVFANNDLDRPILDGEGTQLVTRGTLLVVSVIPAVYWLRTIYRRSR